MPPWCMHSVHRCDFSVHPLNQSLQLTRVFSDDILRGSVVLRRASENEPLIGSYLTCEALGYLIGIFTHLKFWIADAIHNFKWVKIIQICQ